MSRRARHQHSVFRPDIGCGNIQCACSGSALAGSTPAALSERTGNARSAADGRRICGELRARSSATIVWRAAAAAAWVGEITSRIRPASVVGEGSWLADAARISVRAHAVVQSSRMIRPGCRSVAHGFPPRPQSAGVHAAHLGQLSLRYLGRASPACRPAVQLGPAGMYR